MATIYLHIGAPKTATSNIQGILSKSYKKLLSQGVLYPKSCRNGEAHHVLVCDLIDQFQPNKMPDVWFGDYPRGVSWEALRQEINQHGGSVQSVIISSELFFGQTKNLNKMLSSITSALTGHQIKVVIYLRRQDQLFSSFYNQDIKGMRHWSASAYEFYETHQIFQLNYQQIVELWAEAVGKENLILRPYEASQWPENDIVRDFCSTLSLPLLKRANISRNSSLGQTQLYLKRCLNRVKFDKSKNDQVVAQLLQLCPESPAGNILYINRRLYRELSQGWQSVNQSLAQQYFGRDDFFDEPLPAPEDLGVFNVDSERVLNYLQSLLNYLRRPDRAGLHSLFARGAMLAIAEQNLWSFCSRTDLELLIQKCQ